MGKTALATQISGRLKEELDSICEERGTTISRLVEDALREKIIDLKEEEALLKMAMERFADPREHSYQDYKKLLSRLK